MLKKDVFYFRHIARKNLSRSVGVGFGSVATENDCLKELWMQSWKSVGKANILDKKTITLQNMLYAQCYLTRYDHDVTNVIFSRFFISWYFYVPTSYFLLSTHGESAI